MGASGYGDKASMNPASPTHFPDPASQVKESIMAKTALCIGINAHLPSSNYPQSPQLFGPKRNRRFKVLA